MKSSFSSPKTSTARHRTSQSISTTTNPFTQDPLPKSSTSKSKILKTPDVLDTKNSERTRTSSSPQPHHALRDLSNLVGDSLLCSNLNSMGNTPDMSLTNAFNDPLPTPGGSHRKLLEEVNMLKKEVEQKNNMIDKLMKENLNLRKEMEEFLTTVDEAREYIDVELKECNNRIHELENEIQELRAENQVYKDQLSKKVNSSVNETSRENRSGANIFEEDVDGYYGQAKKEMEDFYFRLNEQIINFMEVSKKQYQDFNRIINNKVSQNNTTSNQITREETGAVLKTCPSSPKRDNSSSASAAKLTGPKPARTRNSSMSISYKNTSAKSPKSLRSPMTPKTPKTPKSMGLELKNNKTPKDNNNNMNNGEVSVNRSIDFRSLNQSSASRKRGSCMSMSRLEVEAGNGNANVGMVLNGDVNGQRNPTASHALSPKSSLLRAKLRSDMILQEMRRKIGEGLSNNVNGVY